MPRLLPVLLTLLLASPAAAIDLFIAPDGKDTNRGTQLDEPLLTLEAARDRIRQLKAAKELEAGAVHIHLRAGLYPRAGAFELAAQDGGTAAHPVVIRAYGEEVVRLVGGKPVTGFGPLADEKARARLDPAVRDKVFQADLKAQRIADFGQLTPRGFSQPGRPAPLEAFCGGKPLTLARFPNEGFATIAGVPKGAKDQFQFEGDRPARWAAAVAAGEAWLHGYWFHDWADMFVKVKAIDAAAKTFTLADPQSGYGYKKGQRYYALNVLEELDAPGEYFVDRAAGTLYVYPPAPGQFDSPETDLARLQRLGVTVSLLEGPLVRVKDAAHITFRGLTFECARGSGAVITGGAHCTFAGCTFHNLGNDAVSVTGGTHHQVVSCDVHDTGDGGIHLSGGNRATLEPCHHAAVNNHIHHYSRWVKTYRPAIGFGGVGVRIAHNLIHDAPHTGILGGGNEHLIEFNEMHHLATQTGDVGAFYTGRDWTARGQVVRYNYIHDVGGVHFGAMGVYLDDAASGATVHGNVFANVKRGIMLGGGRDVTITNNLFVGCEIGTWVDARCLGWAKQHAAPGGGWGMYDKLKAIQHDQPPYRTRYPKLATILQEDPPAPAGNVIHRNVFWQCKQGLFLQDRILKEKQAQWLDVKDNTDGQDPLFAGGAGALQYRLRPDSPALKAGFAPLPLEKIGLQVDEYRRTLPR